MDNRVVDDYRLISADGHFNEPGDLWTSRVPAKFRDRVPRIERFDLGDAWVLEGSEHPEPFGYRACAGKLPSQLGSWTKFEDINPGSYDPKARLEEMDQDGVDAEILYPSAPCTAFISSAQEREFHNSMIKAYNDFVVEFCSYAPRRLGGAVALPNRGVADAVAEVERLQAEPGVAAFHLRCYPHGDLDIAPEDDELWGAVEASGKPLTIHISLTNTPPKFNPAKNLPGVVHFYDAPKRVIEFIFTGVLDRFPDLQIFLAEVDLGWQPYFVEQCDDNYLRHAQADLKDSKLKKLPSEYIEKHFPAAFITDTYAIDNRHRIGIERMLWSNDYPHITSDWPNSWKTINASFAGVPSSERHAILAGNALRVFKFDAA